VSLLGALDEPSTLLRWFPALSFPQGTDQLPATTGKGWPASASVIEGTPGGFGHREAAQPMRVAFAGQVEHGVGGVNVRPPGWAIGNSGDLDLAEHRGQLPGVPDLDPRSGGPVGAQGRDPGLSLRAQVQVVLVELAEQLPARDLQVVLQLGVGCCGGLGAV